MGQRPLCVSPVSIQIKNTIIRHTVSYKRSAILRMYRYFKVTRRWPGLWHRGLRHCLQVLHPILEHQAKSQRLHFQSSFLLVHLRNWQKMAKYCSSAVHHVPGSWPQLGLATVMAILGTEPADAKPFSLPPPLSMLL